MERETTCRSADVIGYLVTVSVYRQLVSVDRQLLSVDRQLLSVDRQLLSVDRQLRKCRSTVTKCRLLVKRVTFHVPNGPPYVTVTIPTTLAPLCTLKIFISRV